MTPFDSDATAVERFSIVNPAPHALHECQTAADFSAGFSELTGFDVRHVADHVLNPSAARAIFLVGSIPLGLGTSASDLDFIVLIEHRAQLVGQGVGESINTDQKLSFRNEGDSLLGGDFITVVRGVQIDITVALVPALNAVHARLRSKGPELSENEIRTLSRIATGWCLWQNEGYLQRRGVVTKDSALDVYCATRNLVLAQLYRRKAAKALELGDVTLTSYLGRSSVEHAYLAYLASEGFAFVGPKWVAQIGRPTGALGKVMGPSLLGQSLPLLFPAYGASVSSSRQYLQDVSDFLLAMEALITKKTLFRIAFTACPQLRRAK